jgi:hypothetical protein
MLAVEPAVPAGDLTHKKPGQSRRQDASGRISLFGAGFTNDDKIF